MSVCLFTIYQKYKSDHVFFSRQFSEQSHKLGLVKSTKARVLCSCSWALVFGLHRTWYKPLRPFCEPTWNRYRLSTNFYACLLTCWLLHEKDYRFFLETNTLIIRKCKPSFKAPWNWIPFNQCESRSGWVKFKFVRGLLMSPSCNLVPLTFAYIYRSSWRHDISETSTNWRNDL